MQRLLKGAEEICLKKQCKDSSVREFLCQDIENFLNKGFFRKSLSFVSRLKIIEHELNNLKHDFDETVLDGNLIIHNYEGISK